MWRNLTLKLTKKIVTVLVLVCLLVNMVPVAYATSADEEARRGLDYSELELQIAIANGLNSYEYTAQSWKALEYALEVGNKRLAGIYDQGKLDKAAADIAAAIENLVKMDYSALDKALEEVYIKIDENPQLHDVWNRLDKALERGKTLRISGDQAAVDAVVVELNALLEELATCSVLSVDPEVIIREVEVEVLPSSDFCNIPTHHVWPVLFAISAVLNVALAAALIFVLLKKRNTTDNTPLVSYDIDDDMDF